MKYWIKKNFLERTSMLYEDKLNSRYYGLFPTKNIKEEYSYEGYQILKEIETEARTASDITLLVDINVKLVYRFLIQCYSKQIVRRIDNDKIF